MVDAEIEIELGPGPRPGEYGAKVLRAASGGEPESTFALDVDGLVNRSRTLETTVLASAARARGPVVPELEKPLRQVGSELFRALFAGPIGTAYRASLAVARERGKKLRVVLRITAPELAVMPWEALYDEELQAYICRTEPLVRHIDAPYSPEPLPVRPPLRILGIVASPRGLPELNVDAEKQRLEQALAAPNAAGQVQVEWLTQASWSSVHERLLREQWHVLHSVAPKLREGLRPGPERSATRRRRHHSHAIAEGRHRLCANAAAALHCTAFDASSCSIPNTPLRKRAAVDRQGITIASRIDPLRQSADGCALWSRLAFVLSGGPCPAAGLRSPTTPNGRPNTFARERTSQARYLSDAVR